MTSYPCPFCSTQASPVTGCPGCGRGPDLDASEVMRLDVEIPVITERLAVARAALATAQTAYAAAQGTLENARVVVGGTDQALRRAWREREAAAARVRAAVVTAAGAAPRPSVAPAMTAPVTTAASERSAPYLATAAAEASSRVMQNTLFTLGGLLLAVAAIVFTAVAWSQFGLRGRAALLAVGTVVALAAPLVALRARLRATAETFAAVGLLMVLLDGYAAWHVNLFGLADTSAVGYAGAVCAVTAAVAYGYGQLTGLIGPRFVALVLAQPVLPLMVAPLDLTVAGWAYTMVVVAVANLTVAHLHRHPTHPVALTSFGLMLPAVLVAAPAALIALASAHTVLDAAVAAGALLSVTGVLLTAATLARLPLLQSIAAGTVVVALAAGLARVATVAAPGRLMPVVVALTVSVLAAVVHTLTHPVRTTAHPIVPAPAPWGARSFTPDSAPHDTRRFTPAPGHAGPQPSFPTRTWLGALSRGARTGALLSVGAPALVAVLAALVVASTGLTAPLRTAATGADWQLPVVLLILTLGIFVLVPRGAVLVTGAATIALAAPAALPFAWWAAVPCDLAVVAPALILARRNRPVLAVAAALAAHAVAVAAASPAVLAATLAVLAAAGFAVASRPWWYAAPARAVALVAAPAAMWQATVALWPVDLLAVCAALGLLLTAALRPTPGTARPPATERPATRPPSTPPAAPTSRVADSWIWGAVAILGTTLVLAAGRSLASVLIMPFAYAGTRATGPVAAADAVAFVLAALALTWAGTTCKPRLAAALWTAAPAALLVAPLTVGAIGARWPGLAAASLLSGLTALVLTALLPPPRHTSTGSGTDTGTSTSTGSGTDTGTGTGTGAGIARVVTAAVAGLLTAAGLAGSAATHGALLMAYALMVIAGVTLGVAARLRTVRLAGWLAGSAALLADAHTAGGLLEMPPRTTAFLVLGAAMVLLAGGALLKTGALPIAGDAAGRAAEGRIVQAAAHAGALLALLLTSGSLRWSAAVCTVWGVVLGLRALVGGAGGRRAHVVAAAAVELGAAWLLLSSARVATLEAYTIPAAAVALLAGWQVRRERPGVSSWIAYGPALAAALLPSLVTVLTGDGQPLRRLVLGLAALALTIAGAHRRLQAPVVAGGATLTLIALHESVLVWDLLPRWIPLALAGLLLVALAMTLERRRRDLARFRAALTRMT